MRLNNPLRHLTALAFLLACAASGFAQTQVNTSATTVYVNSNVVTAAYVDVSAAPSGLATTQHDPLGDGVSFDFGDIDAHGLSGMYNQGVTLTPVAGGTMWTTPYRLTPHFSGFASNSASLKVEQSETNSSEDMAVIREGATAAGVSNVPVVGAGSNFTTSASNGTPITRYLGMFVKNDNGALTPDASAGARHPVLIVTLTVE
ncbi:MAG TPA: hypothetical protein VGB98_04450 [Pyrinomonadaceae bacterium]|jgi:hypothetical protein